MYDLQYYIVHNFSLETILLSFIVLSFIFRTLYLALIPRDAKKVDLAGKVVLPNKAQEE